MALTAVVLVASGCLGWLLVSGCEEEVSDVPSDVRVSLQDGVVRCGPFDAIRGTYGRQGPKVDPVAWAPGDSRLAFAGRVSGWRELWVLDPAAGTGACRLRVPAAQSLDDNRIVPLTWSEEGDRLFALVGGYQTWGRYKGKVGSWIVSVPAESGRVRTVAFIRDWEDWDNPPRVTADGSTVVLTGEGIHRVELESGKVTSWMDPRFEDTLRGENFTFTSPGATAVAWDTLGCSDPLEGAGVNVLDTRTGDRVSIAPPPDLAGLWYGLSGWSSDGSLLAVEFAGPEEMEMSEEETFYPVGLSALVLYDASGVERYRLTPTREGWSIGDYAWSPDGTSLLYTQGTVEIDVSDRGPWKVHKGRELWIWSRHSGKGQKLLDTSGPRSVEWETGSVVYVPSEGWPLFHLTRSDGKWTARPINYPWDFTLGEHIGVVYGFRTGKPRDQVLAVRDGAETDLYEGHFDIPELWFGAEHLSFASANVLSEEPDAYLVVLPTP